ncbi:MAG: hypothetical protein AB7O43_16990 [Hyphomicrobiaceae bacterium]
MKLRVSRSSAVARTLAAVAAIGIGAAIAGNAFAQRPNDRRGPPKRPNWVSLGCQQADFRKDRDGITVGRREGRFKALRLRVTGNDIHVNNLVVVYANGNPDNLPVQRLVRVGTASAPIDLVGRQRAIRRVEISYRSRPNFRGRATVCIDALD